MTVSFLTKSTRLRQTLYVYLKLSLSDLLQLNYVHCQFFDLFSTWSIANWFMKLQQWDTSYTFIVRALSLIGIIVSLTTHPMANDTIHSTSRLRMFVGYLHEIWTVLMWHNATSWIERMRNGIFQQICYVARVYIGESEQATWKIGWIVICTEDTSILLVENALCRDPTQSEKKWR